MVDAAPFRALRYDPAVAGDPAATSAPAYDDLERFAYARHRTASPYTVLELLAPSAPTPGGAFRAAGAAFDRWRRTGVLVTEPEPAFYVYEEHELRHGVPALQRGVLAAVRVGDPQVHGHEGTDPARVAERVERLAAVPADLAPVFGVYVTAPPDLRELLDERPRRAPLLGLTDEAGVDHRVWAVTGAVRTAALRRALGALELVIADGHHRWAAAAALRDRRPELDRTLVYLVDAGRHGPQVLPVHRLVTELPSDVEARLADTFVVTPVADNLATLAATLDQTPSTALGLRLSGGRNLLLTAKGDLDDRLPPGHSTVWRRLDTAVLHHAVLPRLGAATVEYRSDKVAAAAEVDARGDAGLFLVRPVDPQTVFTCATAGEVMPPKTTYFRPKPRAGLVMRWPGSDT
ncbi:MAG: DUF1015 family protein [Egibacteraceae bacterium]